MKKSENKLNACYNCIYFKKHYYKVAQGYMIAVGEGSCVLKRYSEEERENLPYGTVCEGWQACPPVNTDLKQIADELADISSGIRSVIKSLHDLMRNSL